MPITTSEHKKALRKPPLCELLPIREYLDGVAVQMDGSFVAGYELDGLNSYYHDDEGRNEDLEGSARRKAIDTDRERVSTVEEIVVLETVRIRLARRTRSRQTALERAGC